MTSEPSSYPAASGREAEHAAGGGPVAPELREEFPGLAIRYLVLDRGSGRSPREVKQRLRGLSDRFTGGEAINLRHRPIPWAYRVFFRHIGLDPDRTRTPVEQLALDRMKHGGFRSLSLLDDALAIATMESGVAMRAFDADRVEGPIGLRGSAPGEGLEGRPGELPPGTLVIADERRPIALLFGATGSGRGVRRNTRRTLLAATQVKSVPDIAVEEALWLAADVMKT
ncbi:MAG: B3/B4 domain-containing protein [Solirubrobacterales bacterium]